VVSACAGPLRERRSARRISRCVVRAVRSLALLILAGLLSLAALYAAAPRWAVRGLREAVRKQDGAAIADAVDLPSVRESLKEQVRRLLEEAAAKAPQPGTGQAVIGRAGPSVALTLAGPLIDRVLTPETVGDLVKLDGEPVRELLRMVHGPRPRSLARAPPQDAASSSAAWLDHIQSMRFQNPLRFAVELEGGWTVYLRPYGVHWRVYDLEVPASLFESPEAAEKFSGGVPPDRRSGQRIFISSSKRARPSLIRRTARSGVIPKSASQTSSGSAPTWLTVRVSLKQCAIQSAVCSAAAITWSGPSSASG
jgi:hypothetical protein